MIQFLKVMPTSLYFIDPDYCLKKTVAVFGFHMGLGKNMEEK